MSGCLSCAVMLGENSSELMEMVLRREKTCVLPQDWCPGKCVCLCRGSVSDSACPRRRQKASIEPEFLRSLHYTHIHVWLLNTPSIGWSVVIYQPVTSPWSSFNCCQYWSWRKSSSSVVTVTHAYTPPFLEPSFDALERHMVTWVHRD